MTKWLAGLFVETDADGDTRYGWRAFLLILLLFCALAIGGFTVRNMPQWIENLFTVEADSGDVRQ